MFVPGDMQIADLARPSTAVFRTLVMLLILHIYVYIHTHAQAKVLLLFTN